MTMLCFHLRQRTKLSDGKWVFQVVANTASGVPGSPVSFPFLVDSTAPTITQFMVGYTNNNKAVNQTAANMGQLLIPASSVTVYLVVSDGLLGSGVASNG